MSPVSASWKAQKRREYLKATGRPVTIYGHDLERAQSKLRAFQARGVTWRQMSAETGIPDTTLCDASRQKYMYRDTWVAIMRMPAIEPSSTGVVDATGTLRRLAALWADGFSMPWLSERTGVGRNQIQKIMRDGVGQVTVRVARSVRQVYDEADGRKPEEFGIPHRSAEYAKGFARKKNLAPRVCWDPDTIDDPKAIPEWTGCCGTMDGLRIHHRERIPVCQPCRDARREGGGAADSPILDAKALRQARDKKGLTRQEIAEAVGVSHDAVYYWERGRSSPRDPEKLDRLAQILGVPMEDICEPD